MWKKIWRILLISVAAFGVTLIFGSDMSQAAKKNTMKIPEENKATFMLMPELPKDNIGGDHLGYFNLQVEPGKERTVRIQVYNPTSAEIKVHGQITDATTNDNASIDYLGARKNNQQLLPHPGSRSVSVPKETKLPAGEYRWITIKVKTDKSFKGAKATAIVLSAMDTNQKSAVNNAYKYAIGLILTGQKYPKQDYRYINSPTIKTRFLKGKKAAISVGVNNPDPMYLEKARINVKLQNQKWRFVQYKTTVKNGKVAPNTSFYVDSLLGGKRLVSGSYRMTMVIKNDHYTKTIHKYVLISQSEAKYINSLNAAYLRNRNLILGSIVTILLIVVLVGLRIYWVKKRKRDLHDAENGK